MLPSVETLVWVWVVSWAVTLGAATTLVVMGVSDLRALHARGERRRSYYRWARGSLFRSGLAAVLSMLMLALGLWRLYGTFFEDEAWLRDTNYGRWVLLGISFIAPVLCLKLTSEALDRRAMLRDTKG